MAGDGIKPIPWPHDRVVSSPLSLNGRVRNFEGMIHCDGYRCSQCFRRARPHPPDIRRSAVRMANLLRIRSSLLRRVAFAPPCAVHAIGAWLYLSPERDRSDETVAMLLDETDPRHLLRAAILTPCHGCITPSTVW